MLKLEGGRILGHSPTGIGEPLAELAMVAVSYASHGDSLLSL